MIYHVATEHEWEAYKNEQVYAPSAFEREGFIHLCYANQLNGVLDRYYKSAAHIILLHINEKKLSSQLKHESGTNGELFPHAYGKINKDAIEKIDVGRENFLQ
ncbi:MAG TPA: DUF952 domain-containing protein [Cyclobacteriaceae bacterium]|nr:DUF952 domain-containing protein [Cyclobacteriaceae bacterium]